jgi:hypothetical protein
MARSASQSRLRGGVGIAILAVCVAGAAHGQAPGVEARLAGTPAKPVCVMVDIAGHTAGGLDCINQTLDDTTDRAQAAAAPHTDAPTIGSSPTRLGEANVAATRQRLGSSFGTSVIPQRPPQPVPPPPLGRSHP